ncbi:hypothetical protein MN032_15995 [Agromyces atrinae]|uniref:hypothetical protein n=1 Tax=Agromyces atrinae TaxID=592376 RepID=UPI001F5ADBC0|nr:hypothetical protein [Agromyces atrinae]MCI2959191.1 hypothetical protein [Agromyces atrinae]
MELLFVALGGALLGIAARYTVPRRSTHGVLVIPAVGALAASVVWVGLTWLGWAWDGGWIWVASLVIGGLVAAAIAWYVGVRRTAADDVFLASAVKNGVPARA